MDQAGLVLSAVAALWIAYLVPHRLRTRQELLESRVDDRFSEGLRVLRVAHAAGTGTQGRPGLPRSHRPGDRPQVLIHPGGRGGGGGVMNRPHAGRDRVVADAVRTTAAQHARRAAYLARRRAAARRRAVLTAGLLLATVVAWPVVGIASAPVALAAVPSVLLVTVLVLGRRAAVAGARADAAWAAGAADRVPLPGARPAPRVTGRAVHPSDAETEVIARVRSGADERDAAHRDATPRRTRAEEATPSAARAEAAPTPAARDTEPASAADAAAPEPQVREEEPSWVPVPVPRPTYTLKPSAPRREPAPLPAEGLATPRAEETTDSAPAATPAPSPAAAGETPSLDLDAILARRRAAGE